MLRDWQLSCVQAEAPMCHMHFALAHCKNLIPIVNFSRLLFQMWSQREWKQVVFSSCSSMRYFLHLFSVLPYWDWLSKKQSRHFLCRSLGSWSELQDQLFWQAKMNTLSSTVSKPNQQGMTFCMFSVKINCSLVLEVKEYNFALAYGMTEFQLLYCSTRAHSCMKTYGTATTVNPQYQIFSYEIWALFHVASIITLSCTDQAERQSMWMEISWKSEQNCVAAVIGECFSPKCMCLLKSTEKF